MATTENINDNQTGETAENGQQTSKSKNKKDNPFSTIILLIVFLVILLSIPLIFTRFNILGAGERLSPILKTNSIFRAFLPPIKDPNDVAFMNREQLINLINDYKTKVAMLETQLKEDKRVSEIYTGTPDGFQKFDTEKAHVQAQKESLEKEKTQLEQDKQKFYEQVKNEDKPSFKDYYEKIDSATAKKLYAEILKEEKISNEIKAFVDYYEKMEPSSAAKIFEQISKSDTELVASIIKNMEKGKASKILQAMDTKVASRVTDILAQQTPIVN